MDEHTVGDELFYKDFDRLSANLQKGGQLKTISSEFAKLTKDIDRVKFVRNLDGIGSVFDINSLPKVSKSSATAQHLRNEGNRFFKNGQYDEALSLYNDSVAYSPDYQDNSAGGKNNLALGYSNRSAALYYLNEYSDCLADIDRAIQAGYVEELQYKLYDRKGKCLHQLKSNSAAKQAFQCAKNLMEKAKLDNKKKETFLKDFEKFIAECAKAETGTVDSNQNSIGKINNTKVPPQVSEAANATYPSLTQICKVAYTPNQGRFLIADRDIKPGEVILVEKPYASVLLPDQYSNHCHHCFTRCRAPVVCLHCPIARYCGSTCRHLSWHSYHKHECDILDIVHRSGVGKFGHLALRTITVSGLDFLLESYRESMDKKVQNGLTRSKESEGCNADGQYLPTDYNTIIRLVTHDMDRPVHDLFRRSAMAVFLTKCLKRSGFFNRMPASNSNNGEKVSEESVITYVGGLILSHLQLLPCNAHEISELELQKDSVASSVPLEIGAGIYATLSLFNHSCDPTVNRNFYGSQCVVRAIKTIKKGEEVSDNYGAVYAMQSRKERQQKLSPQYYFQCACEPCIKNWPLYPHIEHTTPMFKCSNCHKPLLQVPTSEVPCPGCSQVNSLTEAKRELDTSSKSYQEAFESLLTGDVQGALPAFLAHIAMMDRLLVLPWREYNNCQEAIKQCYSIMGNCHIVK